MVKDHLKPCRTDGGIDNAFILEVSEIDRNITPQNGVINGEISEIEMQPFELIKEFPSATNAELAEKSGKSTRTISRLLSTLKGNN